MVKTVYDLDVPFHHFGIPIHLKTCSGDNRTVKKDGAVFKWLVISRLEVLKNTHNILLAVRHLILKEGLDPESIELNIVGHSSLLEAYQDYANVLGVESCVVFHGFCSHDQLGTLFSDCHGVLFVPFCEPMGLIPIEAALHKLPTIGSNYGGPAEIIIENETGLLCDPEDYKDIAKTMMTLIRSPLLRQSLGNAAFKKVVSEFGISHLMDFIEKMFLDVNIRDHSRE